MAPRCRRNVELFCLYYKLIILISLFIIFSEPASILPITRKVVKEGDNLTVMCDKSGIPPPRVFWVKTSNGERTNGIDLVFTNIHRTQSGEYTCKATNPCGDASQSVEIDVQCKQFVKRFL